MSVNFGGDCIARKGEEVLEMAVFLDYHDAEPASGRCCERLGEIKANVGAAYHKDIFWLSHHGSEHMDDVCRGKGDKYCEDEDSEMLVIHALRKLSSRASWLISSIVGRDFIKCSGV
jgi:hypothetical protein